MFATLARTFMTATRSDTPVVARHRTAQTRAPRAPQPDRITRRIPFSGGWWA
jgi:hypothetical protein